MPTKLALVLQNVKHELTWHRITGPWIALGAADHGGPRRARAPWRAAPALGAARWAADLPCVADRLRHQSRLTQHPLEGATGATHRGSWGCGLFPYTTWLFADGSARAAAGLGAPLGGRRTRFSGRPDPIAARPVGCVPRGGGHDDPGRNRRSSGISGCRSLSAAELVRLKPLRLDRACPRNRLSVARQCGGCSTQPDVAVAAQPGRHPVGVGYTAQRVQLDGDRRRQP